MIWGDLIFQVFSFKFLFFVVGLVWLVWLVCLSADWIWGGHWLTGAYGWCLIRCHFLKVTFGRVDPGIWCKQKPLNKILQGTNKSHLGKRRIIFGGCFGWDVSCQEGIQLNIRDKFHDILNVHLRFFSTSLWFHLLPSFGSTEIFLVAEKFEPWKADFTNTLFALENCFPTSFSLAFSVPPWNEASELKICELSWSVWRWWVPGGELKTVSF